MVCLPAMYIMRLACLDGVHPKLYHGCPARTGGVEGGGVLTALNGTEFTHITYFVGGGHR